MPVVKRPIIPERLDPPEPLVRPRRWTRIGWAAAGAGALVASVAGGAIATAYDGGGHAWRSTPDLDAGGVGWRPTGDFSNDGPTWTLIDDRKGNGGSKGETQVS